MFLLECKQDVFKSRESVHINLPTSISCCHHFVQVFTWFFFTCRADFVQLWPENSIYLWRKKLVVKIMFLLIPIGLKFYIPSAISKTNLLHRNPQICQGDNQFIMLICFSEGNCFWCMLDNYTYGICFVFSFYQTFTWQFINTNIFIYINIHDICHFVVIFTWYMYIYVCIPSELAFTFNWYVKVPFIYHTLLIKCTFSIAQGEKKIGKNITMVKKRHYGEILGNLKN